MSDVPPPPPPHGTPPRSSGLPPGKYDIFVIPEHSAGAGFLYLPSLRPNVNSFFAGFASALILVAVFQSMAPAFRVWWQSFQGLGNMGLTLLIFGVGFGAWALGRTQKDGPSTSSNYHSSYSSSGGGPGYTPGGFGSSPSGSPPPRAAPHGSPPPPPPHSGPPPHVPRGGGGGAGPPPQTRAHSPPPQSRPRSPPPQPRSHSPRPQPRPRTPPPQARPRSPPPQARPRSPPPPPSPPPTPSPPPSSPPLTSPPPTAPPKAAPHPTSPPPTAMPPKPPPPTTPAPAPKEEKPKASLQRPTPPASTQKSPTPKGAWEKAREETRRKEEERKAKEAEQKRREEALRRLAELRAKEAKEREEREKEKERKEKEAREKKMKEEADQRRKELVERLRRERAEKAKEEQKKKEEEATAAAAAAATTTTTTTTTTAAPTTPATPAPPGPGSSMGGSTTRVGSTYAFSSVGERTSMWPNGRPPQQAKSATTSSPAQKTPSAEKRQTAPSESTYSYRPYDEPKKTHRQPSMSSYTGSDASWAQSHTTARTTPTPSVRGPYTTKDPDKIVIQAVYLFMNEYAKTPASQLVSGVGSVTDGLILRITTEGLFIDDDVRGVPQREWDVKAWTLKLVEVWCPPHCLGSSGGGGASNSSSRPISAPHLLYKMATARKNGERDGGKVLTGEEADAYLGDMLRTCKECCRLGLCDATLKKMNMASSSQGQMGTWKQKGLHILRATIRDQAGKRYMFVMSEQESWKLAFGLQRLRGGTQVRQLGVAGMASSEARGTLEMLGWSG